MNVPLWVFSTIVVASSLSPPPTSRKDSGHAIGVGFGSGNKNWLRIATKVIYPKFYKNSNESCTFCVWTDWLKVR